jgi:hypothetical protein
MKVLCELVAACAILAGAIAYLALGQPKLAAGCLAFALLSFLAGQGFRMAQNRRDRRERERLDELEG